MASLDVLVFGLLVMMSAKVEMTRLQPGDTHQFDHDGYRYWAKIGWWGHTDFNDAQRECASEHGAEVVKITSDEQYSFIQIQVAGKIPENWNEVMLWTSDSETTGTYQMLVIWSSQSVGTNKKENHAPSYGGHGYVCQKRNYSPGSSYHFQYNGDDYWFRIDWWGTVSFADALSECKSKYSAEVLSVFDDGEYAEVQSQVEGKIPLDWREVMLWTNDTDTAGTKEILLIWRPGTGGPNRKEKHPPNYRSHGYVCHKTAIGHTYQFQYSGNDYWIWIDWWGTVSFTDAQTQCSSHSAELVSIFGGDQKAEIERQVERRIPNDWSEVMLWTKDSESQGTNVMLVVWREGTGGPNRQENHPTNYRSHGYVCIKRNNQPGNTNQFDFEGLRYWFMIGWWGRISYDDAVRACANDHGAEVATAQSTNVYNELRKQIEYRIPLDWREVMLWTRDSDVANTNVMLVVSRKGTDGPNRKENHQKYYEGHGYICQKQI